MLLRRCLQLTEKFINKVSYSPLCCSALILIVNLDANCACYV